ncbi:hypothetical protein [Beijerinckia indica]|uniref:Uncharacterized protein n=1 Tax=Beijerinckia indica subsp. indica (strain ATCC 9039 / DSM 1715 / NCIMB 8712) TaxID=395963 RepID=B2IGZ0_BEII9|nr:hypothetical protein [Beijerinckia indica]ACB94404.1 hypothetical protein Bind_0754 [Beijerinckia indica subsp. indica ATCC 9039]
MTEPQDSFTHASFKVQWAFRHINDLNWFCHGFINAKPYTIRTERNNEGVAIIQTGVSPGIPPQIPLFAGDIVHALRCALDYCWMGLERSVFGDSAKKKTFPVHEERQNLVSPVSEASKRWTLPQIETFIFDKIAPYKAGNELLWQLNRLDNRDKHNLLIVSLGKISFSKLNVTASDGSCISSPSGFTLVVGQEVPLAAVGSPGCKVELDYEIAAPVDIVVNEAGVIESEPLIPTLLKMAEAVNQVVELFRQTFS